MANVTVYCTQFCPYCTQAKQLLDKKGVKYKEMNIDRDSSLRSQMQELSGRTSVPQIFIDDFHVGGCDDLFEMDFDGELDSKLGLK